MPPRTRRSQPKLQDRCFYIVPGNSTCTLCNMPCGVDDNRFKKPWQLKFRALYPDPYNEIKLTEVGFFQEYEWYVLNEEDARWDAGDATVLKEHKAREIDGLYLFHDQCWGRLMEHFCPGEFDVASFHLILPRFPNSGVSPNFDHLYREKNYDDEDEVDYDIFAPVTIEQLMFSTSTKAIPKCTDSVGKPANKTDLFSVLPVEVREMVAVHLLTHDFLALRSVSRAMVPIFGSTKFWRSRFFINEERGYLHYVIRRSANDKMNHQVDWRLLYHCTCKIKCGLKLQSQIRMWEELRWLRDATLAIQSRISEMPPDYCGRALQHYHNSTPWVRNTHTESVEIGPSLCEIAISICELGDDLYVTGMKFIFDDRPDVLIGYAAPGAMTMHGMIDIYAYCEGERNFKYPGIQVVTRVSHLLGFSVNIDEGIQDITILQRNGRPAGMSSRLLRYKDFLILDEVTKVIATLDHCKLMELGIHGTVKDPSNVQGLEGYKELQYYCRNGYMKDRE